MTKTQRTNGRHMQRWKPFRVVRSFTRFLTLGVTVGIGVTLCLGIHPFPVLPVLLTFSAASGIAWFLSGWFADAAFEPIASTVERGVVVGLLVAAVASIGCGIDVAMPVLEVGYGTPSQTDIVKTYLFCVGIVSALAAVPGTVLGAVLGLVVQARAARALHATGTGDCIKTV